jgi:MFS family permease
MGVWGGVAAGGAAAGVLLGGVLTQYLSWRWNFFVNVPVGLFVVLSAIRLLPHHIGEENKKMNLDLPGAVLATSGLMSLVYGLSKAPQDGWGSTTVWSFIAAGIVVLLAFLWNESRAKQPLMPLDIFKIRNVLGANVAFLVIACTLFSMFFFTTLYAQQVLGYSPLKAGLSFLPITFIVGTLSAIISGQISRFGYKPFMNLGPVFIATGLLIMSLTMKVGGNYWHNVIPGLAVFACGMGFTFVAGTLAATSGVPKHYAGLASGILNTSQQVGGAIGLAVLSAVAFSTIKTDTAVNHLAPKAAQVNGYKSGIHVGVGLALTAALVVFLVVRNRKIKNVQEAMSGAV